MSKKPITIDMIKKYLEILRNDPKPLSKKAFARAQEVAKEFDEGKIEFKYTMDTPKEWPGNCGNTGPGNECRYEDNICFRCYRQRDIDDFKEIVAAFDDPTDDALVSPAQLP